MDPADVATLDDEGRPAPTINTILPTVNAVLGEQRTRRADVSFKPGGIGNQDTADILTKVFLQISQNNKLDNLKSTVFADGLIQDRGYFDKNRFYGSYPRRSAYKYQGSVRYSD